MTAPDVVAVVAQEPYLVRVVFADGEVRDVDIAPLLDVEVFALLRERTEFERVCVDEQTGAVAWPSGRPRSGRRLCHRDRNRAARSADHDTSARLT